MADALDRAMAAGLADRARERLAEDRELKALRQRLKSGEYDGVDVMKAWLALDDLMAERKRYAELFAAYSEACADAAHVTQAPALTDDDIAAIAERLQATDPSGNYWREFARAVEAHIRAAEGALVRYTHEPEQDALLVKFAAAGFKYDGHGSWRADLTTDELLTLATHVSGVTPTGGTDAS